MRSSWTIITSGARPAWARATQLARFVETQLGPSDMIGLMYPLEPIASVRMTRNHDAVVEGVQQFLGRKYDYTPKNEYEEKYRVLPDRDGRDRSAIRSRCRRSNR